MNLQGFQKLFSNPAGEKASSPDNRTRIYHYRRDHNDEKSRIHLRIDPDGSGTLIVNANRIVHLNPTATLMAHSILDQATDSRIIRLVRKKYHTTASQVRADLIP